MDFIKSEGNMKKKMSNFKCLTAAGLIVTIFPGCSVVDYFKNHFGSNKTESGVSQREEGKSSSKTMLAVIDGKGFLPKEEFDAHLVQMIQAYPQLRGANITPESLPAGLKKAVLAKLIEQKLIELWAQENNVDKTEEFQKAYLEALENLKRLMFVNQFEKQMISQINVSERDIREEYEKNKTKFAKVVGGVTTSGVCFEDPKAAQEFLVKTKGNETEFNRLASEEKEGKFRSFGNVNNDSYYVPETIKSTALNAKKYPMTTIITSDKENWVICALDKKESEYRPYEEVRGDLENALKGKKFQEILERKMNELKSKHSIKVNDYLIEEAPMQMPMPMGAMSIEDTEDALGASNQEVMSQKQPVAKPAEKSNAIAL